MYEVLKEQLDKHLNTEHLAHQNMEEKIDEFGKKIDNLKDNHLHHLSIDINSVKKDMWWVKLIGGFVIANLIGILITLLTK